MLGLNRPWRWTVTAGVLLLSPAGGFAAGSEAETIVFVADPRRFSGWAAWLANLYNENLSYFTILTVVLIPCLGFILGKLTGLLLARVGINLTTRSIAEH